MFLKYFLFMLLTKLNLKEKENTVFLRSLLCFGPTQYPLFYTHDIITISVGTILSYRLILLYYVIILLTIYCSCSSNYHQLYTMSHAISQ